MFGKYGLMMFVLFVTTTCLKEKKDGVNALILAPQNLGANYYLMRDVIEEYGWEVTHTAALDTVMPCPWFAAHGDVYPIIPDVRLNEITDIRDYDCLIIPPSAGNAAPIPNSNSDLLESKEALMLIKRAAYYDLPVFSTCAGVRVLAAADVLRGKFVVGSPRFRDEYVAAGANYIGRPRNDNPPTIDGNIITSARGQYYNYANVMAIATVLEGNQSRNSKKKISADHIATNAVDFLHDGIVWAKTYGGPGADGGRAFCQTEDGGYLIVGYTFSPGSSDADALAIKTDAEGNIAWSRLLGGSGTEYGNACSIVDDGYLILGYTTSFGSGSKDVYLVKLDKNGNELWSKTYGGNSWDVGTAICRAENGGYYICGYTHSFGWGEEDIYLVSIDLDGNEMWSKTYGGFRIDMANGVHSTPDGGCLISATSGSYSANTDFFLTKIDANGEQEWAQSYRATGEHGHDFDWCKNSSTTRDGGCVLTGYSDCNDMMDVVVIKTDAEGNEQWHTSFGNEPFYDYGNSVMQQADGGYISVGITKSMTEPKADNRKTYNNDIYLVGLDTGGDIIWERTVGGPGAEWANAMLFVQGGDLLLLGHTDRGVSGSLDVCLFYIGELEK